MKSRPTLFAILVLAFTMSFAEAQENSEFFKLGEVERQDFIEYARRLFVLGSEAYKADHEIERSGLLQYQNIQLQKLNSFIHAIDPDDSNRNELLATQARQLFRLHQATVDWSVEFQYGFGQDPHKIAQVYSDYLKSLREPSLAKYDDVVLRTKLEMDQKIFRVRFPVISSVIPFAGLRGIAFDRYLQMVAPDSVRELPLSILEKIRENRSLDFYEFQKVLKATQPNSPDDIALTLNRYFLYSTYGSLPTDPTSRPYSFVDFQHRIDEAKAEVRALAIELNLENRDQLTQLDSATTELVWQTYNASWIERWSPQWDETQGIALDSEDIQGVLWVKYQFGETWPKLLEVLQDAEFSSDTPTPHLKQFLQAIDDGVQKDFPDDAVYFEAALDQVRRGVWAQSNSSSFAYRLLTPDLRALFIARCFPSLTLRLGRALITKGFFHLTPEDQAQVIEHLQSDPESLFALLKRKSAVNLKNSDQIDEFHDDLVHTYLAMLFPDFKDETDLKSLTHMTLNHLDPSHPIDLPTTESLKNRMSILVDQNRDNFDYGAFRNFPFLVDWLTVHVYPESHYWSDEWLKFKDEWILRQKRRQMLIDLSQLQSEIEASSASARATLVEQYDHAINEFNTKFNDRSIDAASIGVNGASFLYGLTPKDWKDMGSIAKTIGTGALFFWATEFMGAKWVLGIILADTSVRVVSAKMLSPDETDLLHLDLSQGFSLPILPIGKWTAEMIQDIVKTADDILESPVARVRLDRIEHAGEIGSSFAWFAVGASLAKWTTDFGAISRFHRIEYLNSKLKEIRSKIDKKNLTLRDLDLQRTQLEESLQTARQTFGSTSRAVEDLLIRKTALHQQIDIVRHGTLASYQGRLEFYIKRIFIELGRSVAFFANPAAMFRFFTGTKIRGLRRSLFERFSRDEAHGISQLEQYMQLIEQKIQRLEVEGFRAESMPWIKEFRFRYEDWRLRRRELSASRALETFTEKLDQIGDAPHAKNSPRYLMEAVDSLQQAYLLFSKDISSIRWLAENSKMRELLGRREAVTGIAEAIRGHIENSGRTALGGRPRKVYEPSVNDFTKLFFGRSYLRLLRQAETLKNSRELLESGIRSGGYPYNLDAIRNLDVVKTVELVYNQRIDAFRAEFDSFFKSDLSPGQIPAHTPALSP